MEMKSVPANGAVTEAMLQAGLEAWDHVMEGKASNELSGDALIAVLLMNAWRDMLEACTIGQVMQ